MPTITRQKPPAPRPVAQTQTNGSILARARPVSQLRRAPLKILMYGGNRVGKSTLACKFAKPLLVVSFEPTESGGVESVRKEPGVDVLLHGQDFTGLGQTVTLARELKTGSKYKTVVIDSATSMQDMVLREIMDLPELPQQNSWGTVNSDEYRQRSEKTREGLYAFLQLPTDVIVLAKEKDHNPPKEERVTNSGKIAPDMRAKFLRGVGEMSFIAADIGGATAGWLSDVCDCICRLYVDELVEEIEINTGTKEKPRITKQRKNTGRYVRVLRTGYHPNYAAGIRSCDPDTVPDVIIEPTVEKILKAIRGE